MRTLRLFPLHNKPWRVLTQHSHAHLRCMAVCSEKPDLHSSLLQPLQEIEEQLVDSISAVQAYQQQHPAVTGLHKLTRRIKSDVNYIRQLSSQSPQLTETRLQGCMNNLRGFKGEMLALQEAPGVVAVCQRFRTSLAAADGTSQQQAHVGRSSSRSRGRSSSSSSSSSSADESEAEATPQGRPSSIAGSWQLQAASSNGTSSPRAAAAAAAELVVEVDVVADGGLTWIEVKNQERFGIQSGHFVGGSHGKGLAEQVAQMLAVAAAPEHRRRGRSPQVVVFFPSGVDAEVEAALTQLGARMANGPSSLAPLCGVQPNNVSNLDVTTLCGLVSEVTWRDPHCPALEAWASRTSHWRECLEAQQRQPLLAELEAVLGPDRQLVVSCAAVAQFEILLQQFSGPLERQRWGQLLPRLTVYHCTDSSSSASPAGQQACAVCGEGMVLQHTVAAPTQQQLRQGHQPQLQGGCFPMSERLQGLDRMTLLALGVFSLGDALHALTLTANGSAVRAAAAAGVVLDVQTHRPVWLTGL